MKAEILLADDSKAFLKTRGEYLEQAGYQVRLAHGLAEARQVLETTWLHVAVIDLRLVDDQDDGDVSGLALIRELPREIPKIILTAYPTWQAVRSALGPIVDQLPPAVDFVAKQDGPAVMLAAIERALAQHVRRNTALDIQLGKALAWWPVMAAADRRLERPELMPARRAELEDLLRKLFYDHQRIILQACAPDAAGIASLQIRSTSARGAERWRVRCGPVADVSAAILENLHRPILRAQTLHYAAAAYRLTFWQTVWDTLPEAGKLVELAGALARAVRGWLIP